MSFMKWELCENVDSVKYLLNADINKYSLPGGGTISPDLCVTPKCKDIVIHDRLTNRLLILSYSPFCETLPKPSLQIHWISVRFYEMGNICPTQN